MNPMEVGEAKKSRESGNGITRKIGLAVALLILGVIGYSIFVALHDADPQETVILGQTTLASDSPAGFRILVRNRTSLKPIAQANVELSLFSQATGTMKLGVFRTDSTGSLADAINIPAVASGEYHLGVDVRNIRCGCKHQSVRCTSITSHATGRRQGRWSCRQPRWSESWKGRHAYGAFTQVDRQPDLWH